MQHFYFLRKHATAVVWLIVCVFCSTRSQAQSFFNPLAPVLGFNVFTNGSLTAGAGDTHGPVAMAGDLILAGSTIFTMNTTGTYPTNTLNHTDNYGMVIGGKIEYQFGNASQLNRGYLRMGSTVGSTLWYISDNGQPANLRVVREGDNYSSQRALHSARPHDMGTVTSAHNINFDNAFTRLRSNSLAVKNLFSNAACSSYLNIITIPNENNPKIRLVENKINYINLTTTQLTQLNAQGSITFEDKPSLTRIVIINIIGTGTYNWQTPNFAGVDEDNGAFMLWNFSGLTGLNIQGGNSTYGSILAPDAVINKTGGNNTNGQVASQSLAINHGEIHYHAFRGMIPDCSSGGPLAVRGMQLGAVLRDQQVQLEWKVTGEENILHYELERSTNGTNFTTISNTSATQAVRYSSTDIVLPVPVAFYRVTAVENTGKKYLSAIVSVRPIATGTTQVWPTKVTDKITIAIKSTGNQSLVIQFTDMQGRVVLNNRQLINNGSNQFSITGLERLAPGMYAVKITGSEGTIHTQKIIR